MITTLKYNFIRTLFILSGGKFYLDWILITNPTSKNPLIRLLIGRLKEDYSGKYYEHRFSTAKICFIIHFIGMIIYSLIVPISHTSIVLNLLVNFYPMIVQLWIGYRCLIIIETREHGKHL